MAIDATRGLIAGVSSATPTEWELISQANVGSFDNTNKIAIPAAIYLGSIGNFGQSLWFLSTDGDTSAELRYPAGGDVVIELPDESGTLALTSSVDPASTPLSLIVAEGDSLTRGAPISWATLIIPDEIGWQIQNVAIGGSTASTVLAGYPTRVVPFYDASRQNNILVLWVGTNDLTFGTAASTILTNLQSIASAARSTGFIVLVGTIIPNASHNAGAQTQRGLLNTSITTNSGGWHDGAIDYTTNAAFNAQSDTSNLTYYQGDGTHLTQAGEQIIADFNAAAVSSVETPITGGLLAGAGANNNITSLLGIQGNIACGTLSMVTWGTDAGILRLSAGVVGVMDYVGNYCHMDAAAYRLSGAGIITSAGYFTRNASMNFTNGSTSQVKWTDNSDGTLGTPDIGLIRGSFNVLKVTNGGSAYATVDADALRIQGNGAHGDFGVVAVPAASFFAANSAQYLWNSGSSASAFQPVDTGLARNSAGVVRITDGSSGTGSLKAAGQILGYAAKTTSYSVTTSDYTVDLTSGTATFTLPTAVGISGQVFNLKNTGGILTAATTSAQTIDGLTTQPVAAGNNLQVQSNGANWIIL